ncbi:UDP-2,3-diacylglucosamine hydrolase [Thioalkalivibrio nitratireducens DSM 14787]|uniref:UDP-2,3-diacylglucosamine hydrolase n=1 Tax=Thioalkalivibrio nitratireducens (strain DSM 14787 / UNIQEM 213 / ALEN2) TaxID=1255043 RepID=L0DZ08_THIND|nr:UDP-2,3-diacylglucosamine diphosphatase [Thioalkalivibrio nitratireducens]AGA34819.1 UDP-2,3-diacylglucosamine hydrolase [Thioalkalivibrio nitratireducens DSM 14787]
MSPDGPVLVVSDLHLDRESGPTFDRFLEFLRGPARTAAALYILGDLFEYWIGDDARFDAAEELAGVLARLPLPVTFQHGNRDFLLGAGYAQRAGMQIAPEELRVPFPCGPALLMHGDSLCTADIDYLKFREIVRQPDWQQAFLARPLPERIAEAERLRAASRDAGRQKARDITDVHPNAVTEVLRAHGVSLLIHGHTHRPAIHGLQVDGRPCLRCVLPAWDERPGYLAVDARGPRLLTLDGQDYPSDAGHPPA